MKIDYQRCGDVARMTAEGHPEEIAEFLKAIEMSGEITVKDSAASASVQKLAESIASHHTRFG